MYESQVHSFSETIVVYHYDQMLKQNHEQLQTFYSSLELEIPNCLKLALHVKTD